MRLVCAACEGTLAAVINAQPDAPLLVTASWRADPPGSISDLAAILRSTRLLGVNAGQLWAPLCLLLNGGGPELLWMPCRQCRETDISVSLQIVLSETAARLTGATRSRRLALRSGTAC